MRLTTVENKWVEERIYELITLFEERAYLYMKLKNIL